MPDFETAEVGRIGKRRFGMLLDVRAKLALRDRLEERSHLALLAGCLECHSAITEIPDGARDVEPLRDLLYGIAKADALDVSFVENLNGSDHVTGKIDPACIRRQPRSARFTVRVPGAGDRDQATALRVRQGADHLSRC